MGERVRVVRAHGDPGLGVLEGALDLGALVDAGHDGATGGEDRVELRRHARPGETPPEGHDVDVARGQDLGQAVLGLHVHEVEVVELRGAGLEFGALRSPAVDDELDVGAVDPESACGLHDEIERLGEPDVAGVHDDGTIAQTHLAPVRVVTGPRADPLGVDEVGDDPDLARLTGIRAPPRAPGDLRPHVVGEVVGEHGDGVGEAVGHTLEPVGHPDGLRTLQETELDGHVGEHVLDVEHEGDPAGSSHEPTGRSECQRGGHRQDRIGPLCTEAHQRSEGREATEGQGAGGDVATIGGEGVDPRDASPAPTFAPDQATVPTGFDGVALVPGQRRDDLHPMSPRHEFVDDTAHDLAGGGHVGLEVRTEHDQVHGRPPGRPSTLAASR